MPCFMHVAGWKTNAQNDKANFGNGHKVTDTWHKMLTQSNAFLVVSSLFTEWFWGNCIPTDFEPDQESPFCHKWLRTHHFGCFEQIFVIASYLMTASAKNSPEQGCEHTATPAQIFCLNLVSPSFLPQTIQCSLPKIESKVLLCNFLLRKSKKHVTKR